MFDEFGRNASSVNLHENRDPFACKKVDVAAERMDSIITIAVSLVLILLIGAGVACLLKKNSSFRRVSLEDGDQAYYEDL